MDVDNRARFRARLPLGVALAALLTVPAGVQAQESEAAASGQRPRVVVIGTGGTIAGQSETEVSFQHYRSGSLSIAELVDQLPHLDEIADVSTIQFDNKGSSGYTIPELYRLSLTVDSVLAFADGVVVTSGTDTMEEIAYFLDLTVRSPKPVVTTGAMRPWTVIGSDAPANLYNAIRLAASGRTARFGAVLTLNDVIHAARDVTKRNSYRLDTFESPVVGALGYIDEDRIRIYRAPARAHRPADRWATPFDLHAITADDLPRVEIIYSYQDAGGEAIDAFVEAGVRGFVTAGTGAGGISRAQRAARRRALEKGAVFVATTRTGSGSVYGTRGRRIAGDNLLPQKARLLLLLSMAFSDDVEQVAAWFAEWGGAQVPVAALPPTS